MSMPIQLPLSITVVYHPDSAECRSLAAALHDWFRLKQDDGDGTEAGLPVWYRARAVESAEGAGDWRLSPAIDWEAAALNVLVFLVDDHMVADVGWRKAVAATSVEARDTDLQLPAVIDASAFRLTCLFDPHNALPAGPPRPDTEPQEPTDEPTKAARKARIAARARVLRRAVTEAVTRKLRAIDKVGPPAPLDVFLSHAKRDGAVMAQALRERMVTFAQLKPWYDASDIAHGFDWRSRLDQAAGQSAALVSVVTSAYPSRPWCRREVQQARTPQRLDKPESDSRSVWTVQPAVALISPSGTWTRPMAQLAQVPHVGWATRPEEIATRTEDVVDRLLLEALLVEFYRKLAQKLKPAASQAPGPHLALITWVPDPWSLAFVINALSPRGAQRELVVAYPGHGLRTAERIELEEVARAAGPEVRLVTQERLSDVDPPASLQGLQVVLSASGAAADLEPAGVGPQHIADLLVRLTRRLLERQCVVAYGGTLNRVEANFTQTLIEVALGWMHQDEVHRLADGTATCLDPDAPSLLVNYAAWPHDRAVTLRHKAQYAGICRFVAVPGAQPAPSGAPAPKTNPRHARLAADALTAMRRLSTEQSHVRVVAGGKIRGWTGWLPGILEEVACSLEQEQLPLILGGFGGCAGLIAAFLRDVDAAWPDALTFDAARDELWWTRDLDGTTEQARRRFAEAESALRTYRDQLHGTAWPFDGVGPGQVQALLEPMGATDTIRAVLAALPAPPPHS